MENTLGKIEQITCIYQGFEIPSKKKKKSFLQYRHMMPTYINLQIMHIYSRRIVAQRVAGDG